MKNKHSHLAVFSPQQCPQKYFLTVENINQYFICHPSSCDHCQSSHQVAVLRAPSPHHCRDVFIFQTQPYSLFRFVEPPMFTFDDDLYRPQYSSLLCIYILWCVSCNIAGTVRLVYSLCCVSGWSHAFLVTTAHCVHWRLLRTCLLVSIHSVKQF